MKENIKRVQISIGGLILGITATGNLLNDYIAHSRQLCGIIASILLILVILKLIYYPKYFKEDLDNPVLASIMATFSMTLMLLSNYFEAYTGTQVAISIWFFAIILHTFFVLNYIYKYVLHFKLEHYTAGSFVVFAGIQMIAITAPQFHQESIGNVAFWISLISVVLVFIVVCCRYIKIGVNSPLKPVLGVYAAPFSLCAVGYLSSVSPNNFYLVLSFYTITKILYIMVLAKFVEYRHLPFYPTYAAYTFPIVINAITTLKTKCYLQSLNIGSTLMEYELYIEILIALALILYVLYYYMIAIFEIPRKEVKM
ncbi:MAG: hypothetical protein BZ136_02590 [Methanosphaera sp. rholeuAM74]|nr:MAG: hypothetical protein BZ136_02590 [Methanosphaera sp. rholeuAM74]